MATLPTDEGKLRMALDLFEHFDRQPGQGLLANNITLIAAQKGWRIADIARGLEIGIEREFFESGSHSIKLTEAGFAAI